MYLVTGALLFFLVGAISLAPTPHYQSLKVVQATSQPIKVVQLPPQPALKVVNAVSFPLHVDNQ